MFFCFIKILKNKNKPHLLQYENSLEGFCFSCEKICEVFAALKTFFFFTVFTDGILGRTLKYFCLLQKQNIFLQKCYSTQSTNMNKRIRQKCFSEILFSVSDQVKKKGKSREYYYFFLQFILIQTFSLLCLKQNL